jgi:hypothetical protein
MFSSVVGTIVAELMVIALVVTTETGAANRNAWAACAYRGDWPVYRKPR